VAAARRQGRGPYARSKKTHLQAYSLPWRNQQCPSVAGTNTRMLEFLGLACPQPAGPNEAEAVLQARFGAQPESDESLTTLACLLLAQNNPKKLKLLNGAAASTPCGEALGAGCSSAAWRICARANARGRKSFKTPLRLSPPNPEGLERAGLFLRYVSLLLVCSVRACNAVHPDISSSVTGGGRRRSFHSTHLVPNVKVCNTPGQPGNRSRH